MEIYEIPDFSGGYCDIKDDVDDQVLIRNQTPNCDNMDFTKNVGAASKDYGEMVMGSSGQISVLNGPVQLIYEGGMRGTDEWYNKRLVVGGGKVYTYCPGEFYVELSTPTMLSTSTDLIDCCHYIDQFYLCDGTNYVRVWDGFSLGISSLNASYTTGADIDFIPKCVEEYKDRLVFGNLIESGSLDEDKIRWTKMAQPLSLEVAHYDWIITKEGDPIVRMKRLFDTLIVFKKNSVHAVVWTGGDFVFQQQCIDDRVIHIAPYSIAKGPREFIFLTEEGLQYTDGMRVEQMPQDSNVKGIIDAIYMESYERSYAISSHSRHKYYLAVSTKGSSHPNYILIYDWKYNVWSIKEKDVNVLGIWTSDATGNWRYIDDYEWEIFMGLKWNNFLLYPGSKELIYGKTDGKCYKHGIAYANDGAAYNGYIETGWLNLNNNYHTELALIQPIVEGKASTSLDIDYKIDYETNWRNTGNHIFSATGLREAPLISLRDTCRKAKFRFSNNNANEYFNIYKLYIHHQPRGLR